MAEVKKQKDVISEEVVLVAGGALKMVQYHEIVTAHMEGLTLDHESCYGRPVTRATMKLRLDVSTI